MVSNKPKKQAVTFQGGFPFKNQRRYENFQFPQTPFGNPIFDYLQKQQTITKDNLPDEEVAQGQTIRRKVTHQQSFSIVPMLPPMQPPPPFMNLNIENVKPIERKNDTKSKINATLEATIDNIKNIVNSQTAPAVAPYYNPYTPVVPNPFYNPYYGYYGAYQQMPENMEPSRRQIQWPWQQFFPIIIKDPIMQLFNAMTSMVEYGPTATCPGRESDVEENKKSSETREQKSLLLNNLIPKENFSTNVAFTLKFQTPPLEIAERKEKATKGETKRVTLKKSETPQSPPPREPEYEESEAEDIILDSTIEKDDGILHNNNKKFFSKDNTGSGIFIHKIKVRKGGVAIAGPGGIATAGSGGTAIVGPNGFAYTHPDSLAIAGTGSKVIAIDPSVSLSDVVNKTRRDGSTPRQGKVVAVGPVVYYNRG